MTITLRLDKGSELTFQELDNNFTDLNSRLNVLETTDTDNQTLTLNGTTLSISNGNSVDLGSVSASVSIGDSAPITPEAGDLWWQSDVGRLRIYYTDTGGSQWVDASPTGAGGSGSNVTVSDGAPSTPVQGDLWWESDVGKLRIYYNNVWVDAAPSGTGGSTSGDLSIASISALGDVDFNGITLDGSNGQNKVLAWDEALQRFVPRGTAVVTVSDVQPATPVEGDLWWESDVGKLRIYYNDGVQSQWVDANPAGTGVDQDDLNVVTSRGSTTTNTITVGGITSTGDIGITGSLTASGTISSDTSLRTQGNIEFEGSTNNAFETRLQVVDPTQDNTITFQNASGTVAFLSDIVGGGGGLANIVEDTTPQLGGQLDLNGQTVTGTLNIDYDTDAVAYIGKAAIGFNGYANTASFGHIDMHNVNQGSGLMVQGTGNTTLVGYGGVTIHTNSQAGFSGVQTVSFQHDEGMRITNAYSNGNGLVFQGDFNKTTKLAINGTQTGDRTIYLPDASGTIALTSDITSYSNADVDTHLNTSTATANQILSWDGADYAWVADQTGSGSSASNLIAWDLADTANSKVLDAGTVADSAWYYGDVVSDPANPATSVVLDISAATFTGNVMGEVHGDVKQADGLTLILDVDAGVGTAMYYGDVTGNIITESVQPASSTTLDPGTVLTVKGGSTSAVNSVGGDLILDAGSGGAQGGIVKVGTIDGAGVAIGSGTGSIEMNSVTNFNANVDFESGSTVDFTGVTVTGLSGGGSGLQSRGTVTGTTGSLADGDEADLDITGFKSYALLTITTDRAARVRLYVSDATRLADASRAEGVDPTSDAGLIAEVITTGADTVIISPGAYGSNLESTPTTTIPCRVTNKSGGTSTVQVDLNILQLEA